MKYTYKRTITIETEGELPLLGYDLNKAVKQQLNEPMNHILKQSIDDGRPLQTIEVGNQTYTVRIKDTLHQ